MTKSQRRQHKLGNAIRRAVGGTRVVDTPQPSAQADVHRWAERINRHGGKGPDRVLVASRFLPAEGETPPERFGY